MSGSRRSRRRDQFGGLCRVFAIGHYLPSVFRVVGTKDGVVLCWTWCLIIEHCVWIVCFGVKETSMCSIDLSLSLSLDQSPAHSHWLIRCLEWIDLGACGSNSRTRTRTPILDHQQHRRLLLHTNQPPTTAPLAASTCKRQCFDFVSQCSTTLQQFGIPAPDCATAINQAGLEAYPYVQSEFQLSPTFQVRLISLSLSLSLSLFGWLSARLWRDW